MTKTLNSNSVLTTIDRWKRNLYPAWDIERQLEAYANGGPPPSDTENCEDDIVPMGFASTFMKKEMNPLTDVLLLQPGIIDMTVIAPAINDPGRTDQIQMQVNVVVNSVVQNQLTPTLTNAAGRATVTGRSWLYRKSPNTILMKCGRALHPINAGIDILDSDWREWAFEGQISLRDIDERIKSSSEDTHGWKVKGLKQLKEWILAAEAEKYASGADKKTEWMEKYDSRLWEAVDLETACGMEVVDVYWYFRKNGKITKDDPFYGGHEEVDLYCISRFGSECTVSREIKDEIEYRNLDIRYPDKGKKSLEKIKNQYRTDYTQEEIKDFDEANERLLFHMPGLFKSIEECLIFHNDDAAVSGDQKVSEIRGTGKTASPKLAMMEGLLQNLMEGLGFASMMTWSVAPGVDQEYLDQLQRGGLRSGQAMPSGIQPMAKQNSLTGFGAGMQAIRMLDSGISSDSTANQQGTFGSNQAEFASQAAADQASRQQSASRRLDNWLLTLDKVVNLVGRTLCRSWPKQRTAYPCYYDAQRLRLNLRSYYKIHEDEWDADRWIFKARRLAGNMQRQQSIMVNTQMIQVVGPIMPSLLPYFAKEILRATYGDVIAQQLTQEQNPKQATQEQKAKSNITIAFVTGTPPPPEPMDDPMIHSGEAMKFAQNRTQAAMQMGTIPPSEVVGVMAALQYGASHLMRLPEQLMQPAMDQLSEVAKAIQSIPIQSPPDPGAPTQKEMMEMQLKQQNQERLKLVDQSKVQNNEVSQMIKMRQLANAENNQQQQNLTLATNRAKVMQDMQTELLELDEPAIA